MKNIALIAIALFIGSQCYAQSHYPVTRDTTLTTAIDTCTITGNDNIAVTVSISNASYTDTVQFRTELETKWSNLLPRQAFHDKLFAKKIFRRVKSGSATYSQLKVN